MIANRIDNMIGNIRTSAATMPGGLARWFFFRLLDRLEHGRIIVVEQLDSPAPMADGRSQVSAPVATRPESVTVVVHDPRCYAMILTGGSNGAAEAFMSGYWTSNDLVGLLRLLLRNQSAMEAFDSAFSRISRTSARVVHSLSKNTLTGSRKNISAHYDLGNDFFKLFLDKGRLYSSAHFDSAEASRMTREQASDRLDEASESKLETICQRLELSSSDHLVEIGSGWGGMAVHAAERYGCRVTTTTISAEQFKATSDLVAERGLENLVTVLDQDYRKLEGSFDKLVSVEMVEAVGHQFLDGYFETIARLLKPGGMAVLQAITIEDWRYETAVDEVDFIKKYIFPGSFIPAPSVLIKSAARSRLRLQSFDDFGFSYAATIAAWTSRFADALDAVRAQGFEERFIRMWLFYLAYCEAGFRERSISVSHLRWEKPLY